MAISTEERRIFKAAGVSTLIFTNLFKKDSESRRLRRIEYPLDGGEANQVENGDERHEPYAEQC
ncbi:MAG: hypothetical protein QXU11_03125 [Thermoproteota archaeon]